jgi:hypothetical protein
MTATLSLTCCEVLPVAIAISEVVRPSMSNSATARKLARNLSSGNRCLRSDQSRMSVLYYSGSGSSRRPSLGFWRAAWPSTDTSTLWPCGTAA